MLQIEAAYLLLQTSTVTILDRCHIAKFSCWLILAHTSSAVEPANLVGLNSSVSVGVSATAWRKNVTHFFLNLGVIFKPVF